jgi:hypothetical protein
MRYIFELNWKSMVIIGAWSIACSAAIVALLLFSYESSTDAMAQKLDALTARMDCPNNECDRYKGADARRDFARVEKQIADMRKECGCAP